MYATADEYIFRLCGEFILDREERPTELLDGVDGYLSLLPQILLNEKDFVPDALTLRADRVGWSRTVQPGLSIHCCWGSLPGGCFKTQPERSPSVLLTFNIQPFVSSVPVN